MPVPHLHILHPPETRLPGVASWLAELEELLRDEPTWDDCVFHRIVYDEQASFDVPTAVDLVRRSPGPVILLQKVQTSVRERFEAMLGREAMVYVINGGCAEDVWSACEAARKEYEGGEPSIPIREAIAFLILRKLERQGKWGGTNNKNFLWSRNLPKGGFPKDIVEPCMILDAAEALVRAGVLQVKTSQGQRKYALGDKSVVQPILDTRSFASQPSLAKFFGRAAQRVSIRTLDHNQ